MTNEAMNNSPCYDEVDDDPINGRYVNAQHKALLLAYDRETDSVRQQEIFAESCRIVQQEADKGNPLALFYRGVNYLYGTGGVQKDLVRGKALLEKAYELGVQRAMDFLAMHFEGYGEDVSIR